MDWKTFFVELIEVSAWPVVSLLITFLIKDKLPNLFGNLKSAKFKDAEVHFSTQDHGRPENPISSTKLEDFTPKDNTGMQVELEEVIKQQLSQFNKDTDKIKVLVANLAHNQLYASFERVDNTIFGSQIKLLEFMNSKDTEPTTNDDAHEFYKVAYTQNPEFFKTYSFESYMKYLESFLLIQNVVGGWTINKFGIAFLVYLAQTGKTKYRPN